MDNVIQVPVLQAKLLQFFLERTDFVFCKWVVDGPASCVNRVIYLSLRVNSSVRP